MRKKRIFLLLIAVFLLCNGCTNKTEIENPYDREWILGKTRAEIEQMYGELDTFYSDDFYTSGTYTIVEDKKDIFGTIEYGTRLRIYFDEEGKATSTVMEDSGWGG